MTLQKLQNLHHPVPRHDLKTSFPEKGVLKNPLNTQVNILFEFTAE